MSVSLALTNGDISVSSRSYVTVRGKAKLLQDLRLRIIERLGTDPATPDFGSRFDTDAYIGQVATGELEMEARAELLNLLETYQKEQLEKIKAEILRYGGRHTLDKGEVIKSIDSIQSNTVGTTLYLRVTLTTLSDENIQVSVPIQNG